MKYIYIIQKQKLKPYSNSQYKKIKLSRNHDFIYLGKDNKDIDIFVIYFKKPNCYLIKIFKNIIQNILNEEDILLFMANNEGNKLI